ncbi:hypothetical protein [Sandarakinorhabdus oryzae]|uniref:hypothetical protein n=1 Tax=Sandarakinorhabdus oryzae TaxID=2675220 RepID=UPI0012E0C99D|nr:hypothetical protein [Sandarakinorhabdus oryzae]
MKPINALACLGLLLAAMPAQAQAQESGCELHVWLTNRHVITQNFIDKGQLGLVGDIVNSTMDLDSPQAAEQALKADLAPAVQQALIEQADLPALLKLNGHRLVVHAPETAPTWTLEALKKPDRLAPDAPACYAELAFISLEYFREPLGSRLRSLVRYREYDARGKLRAKLLDTTATPAANFPPKRPEERAAATAGLQQAFRGNLAKLAHDKLKR